MHIILYSVKATLIVVVGHWWEACYWTTTSSEHLDHSSANSLSLNAGLAGTVVTGEQSKHLLLLLCFSIIM